MSAPNPFDMNAAIAAMVERQLQERTPLLIAQSLLAAGNNLRGQAFAMTASININQFAAIPAQLEDGSAIVLLTALKHVPNSYRLFVSPVKLADDSLVRSILIVNENEANTIESKFLSLSDEQKAELERQLDAISLPLDGSIELCLAVVTQPIEGYEYFKAAVVDTLPADAAETSDAPVGAEDAVDSAAQAAANDAAPAVSAEDAAFLATTTPAVATAEDAVAKVEAPVADAAPDATGTAG